jgi:hypothetical protein
LHPNSFSFIHAFKLMYKYLEITPIVTFFFSIFVLQRVIEKGGGKS